LPDSPHVCWRVAAVSGIGSLSAQLQSLDLNYACISRQGIRNLVHLTSLQKLNLSHVKAVTVASIQVRHKGTKRCLAVPTSAMAIVLTQRLYVACVQHIPDSVEELDLSYCSNLWFEKRKKSSTSLTSAFSMSQGTPSPIHQTIVTLRSSKLTRPL
jgi:hypothetical protein